MEFPKFFTSYCSVRDNWSGHAGLWFRSHKLIVLYTEHSPLVAESCRMPLIGLCFDSHASLFSLFSNPCCVGFHCSFSLSVLLVLSLEQERLHKLVPRPNPLTRRNSLVNQVELLGLVHTFVTVSPSNVQNVLCQTCSKKVRIFKYNVVRDVGHNNYRSHNLIGPSTFRE